MEARTTHAAWERRPFQYGTSARYRNAEPRTRKSGQPTALGRRSPTRVAPRVVSPRAPPNSVWFTKGTASIKRVGTMAPPAVRAILPVVWHQAAPAVVACTRVPEEAVGEGTTASAVWGRWVVV